MIQVLFATDCIGEVVQKQLAQLADGQVGNKTPSA